MTEQMNALSNMVCCRGSQHGDGSRSFLSYSRHEFAGGSATSSAMTCGAGTCPMTASSLAEW
jgi:hypothetical protein